MNTTVSYYTSKGGRDNNEDYVITKATDNSYIATVCDGLGGHDNGEVASRIAAECIIDKLSQSHMCPSAIEEAVKLANKAVLDKGSGRTTASVIWLEGEDALVANVGDTRIYQFRNNRIIYQNKDHSVAYYLFLNGDIQYEDIRFSKDRNRLTRALGAESEVKVDVTSINVSDEDAFLICSDGFWEYIDEEQMLSTLSESEDATAWLKKMKAIADEKSTDGRDNNTAIAILNTK